MNLKALLGILAVAVLMGTVAYVSIENQTTLATPVVFPANIQIPVYLVMMGGFVAGFLVAFGFALVRSSVLAWGRFRDARQNRIQAKTDSLLAEGLSAMLGGWPDKAESLLHQVLERDPGHAEAHLALGTLMRESHRPRDAVLHHQRALDGGPIAQLKGLLELAADHVAEGETAQAVEVLERAIAEHPKESLTARRQLCDIRLAAGNWGSALELHETIGAARRHDGQESAEDRLVGLGIRYELARGHEREGRLKEADKLYRALVKEEPAFVPAALALGSLQIAADHEDEGIATWIRGFEASGNPVFLVSIEDYFLEREDPNAAIETLKGIAGAAGDRTLATFYLGKIFLRLEMIDEAEVTFASLGEVAANSATLLYYQARVLYRRGQHKDAAELYRGVIQGTGLLELRYVCVGCGTRSAEWKARCDSCGAWGRVEADLDDGLTRRPNEASWATSD